MQISKNLKSLSAAENFQTRLYNKYISVRLVSFPRFSESGVYVWEVK